MSLMMSDGLDYRNASGLKGQNISTHSMCSVTVKINECGRCCMVCKIYAKTLPSALKILLQLLEDRRVRIYPFCRPNETTPLLKVSQVSQRNLCNTDLFQNTVHCFGTADVKADEHRV